MIINFKEIPEAHKGGGTQDTWELFCREFFKSQRYEILTEPTRGSDGGIDIKVKSNDSDIIWLVSCKHKAHSGLSINHLDELNIRDRVESHNCDGFIGFYSTIASSGLNQTLSNLSNKMPFQIFDKEKIERAIVGFHSQEMLFIRFFPESYKTFKKTYLYLEPTKLFVEYFKKEFNDYINVYEIIFNSIENILPCIRRNISFEDSLKNQNITILPIKDIELTFWWRYTFQHSGISKDYPLERLVNELLPNEANYIHGIDVYNNFNNYFYNIDFGLVVTYPNFIICSPKFITESNIIFQKLSDILK